MLHRCTSNTGHTFTGLTNGTEYTFRVRAVNAIDNSPYATATATPTAGTPDPTPCDDCGEYPCECEENGYEFIGSFGFCDETGDVKAYGLTFNSDQTVIFYTDGAGIINGTWVFNETTSEITLTFTVEGDPIEFVVEFDIDDDVIIDWNDMILPRLILDGECRCDSNGGASQCWECYQANCTDCGGSDCLVH